MQRNLNFGMNNFMLIRDYNPKVEYTITKSDGSEQKVKSRINVDTALHKYYLEYEDKKVAKSDPNRKVKIYSDQTISIERPGRFGAKIRGIANDSCWAFKVIDGPVSAYSYYGLADDRFEEESVIAIQKGENMPIVRFNADNLKLMIEGDKEAMEKFADKKYFKALKQYNKNQLKKAKDLK